MPNVTDFLPSTHGFAFGNSWPSQPDKVISTPAGDIRIGDASNGLCGGMAFAVRDYVEGGGPQPHGRRRPALGEPLYDYIVDRLFASFDLPHGPLKYYRWMATPDHDTWPRTGLGRRTVLEEWPKIRDDLDHDRLSPLGLVTVLSVNPRDLGQNHQVLAYGYDVSSDDVLTVKLYDPNSPLDDSVRLSLRLDEPGHRTPITHNIRIANPVRGFFRVPYERATPPQVDDAEVDALLVPSAIHAGDRATVIVTVRNTGTTTWLPGGGQPYRLGSQRPQDNTTWQVQRVELPHAVAPTQQIELTFTVTAPAGVGPVAMGWRMVREGVRWFGELEDTVVDVAVPAAGSPVPSGP